MSVPRELQYAHLPYPYPRLSFIVSVGSIPNQGTFVSVTFGHLPLNLVTFGHLFRGLFEYIYHQTNPRIINLFDSQREYTIANDTITPARGTEIRFLGI